MCWRVSKYLCMCGSSLLIFEPTAHAFSSQFTLLPFADALLFALATATSASLNAALKMIVAQETNKANAARQASKAIVAQETSKVIAAQVAMLAALEANVPRAVDQAAVARFVTVTHKAKTIAAQVAVPVAVDQTSALAVVANVENAAAVPRRIAPPRPTDLTIQCTNIIP